VNDAAPMRCGELSPMTRATCEVGLRHVRDALARGQSAITLRLQSTRLPAPTGAALWAVPIRNRLCRSAPFAGRGAELGSRRFLARPPK
jgi:hypothetical protein